MTIAATTLAISLGELPWQVGHIFYFIVLPMLLVAGAGYLIQRTLGLDLQTLKRLNFYFVMPAIIYYSVVTSTLTAAHVGEAILFALALFACMSLLTLLVVRILKVPRHYRNTAVLTTALYNSGNYGLPLQDRVFAEQNLSSTAMSLQAVVMIAQNVLTFTVGIFVAAGGRKDRHWKANLLHIVKLPPIYALAAAVITLQIRNLIGEVSPGVVHAIQPWWKALMYVKEAFIGVALVTLGAQLAAVKRGHARYPVKLSVFLRLLIGPAMALGIIYAFGIRGLVAQVLLIASSAPTAVNCMLLCLEFDNNPDYAATAVFYSSLLSPITGTLVIFLARGGLLPGFNL